MNTLKRFIYETVKHNKKLQNDITDFGLFISIPDNIIRQVENAFPDIKKLSAHDDSPNHITLLIINSEYDKLDAVKDIIENVIAKFSPFKVLLGKTGIFNNKERNEKVLFIKILSEQLIKIHYALKGALENENIKINHFYGEDEIPIYEPHTTLAYYENDDNNSYALPDLNVSWLVDRIEMWGNMSPILFRLEN